MTTAAKPVARDVCRSAPCLTPGFCQNLPPDRAEKQRPPSERRSRPTPRTTVEAILWCVRERGIEALRETANIERLLRCDSAARAEINERITRGIASKGVVA
jgi:hypothetical protein